MDEAEVDAANDGVLYMASAPPAVIPDAVATINRAVDHLSRFAGDQARRFFNAEKAGVELASTVQRFLSDPAAVGTDALYAAYGRFMTLHAGNFSSSIG